MMMMMMIVGPGSVEDLGVLLRSLKLNLSHNRPLRTMGNVMNIYLRLFVCANLILLPGCGKEGEDGKIASASLTNARKLYDAGRYQSARIEIEAAIKADPRVSDAHFLAGQIAEKLGDLQTALKEYVGADATAPRSEKARTAAAALLIRARAYNLAEEWIGRCLADLPNDKAMRAYRALLQERLGNNRKARADAEAILAENRGNAVANAVLAEEALRREDPADALTKIETGLSTDPSDRALLQLKAEAFSQQESPEKAIEIYKALIASDPTVPDYRVALAELLAKSSGIGQGEQVLRAGVEVAPGNIEMHMQLVSFLARHRDEKAVVGELLSAVAAAPESTVYDIALADIYAGDNEFDAAAKVLNDAIARTQSGPGQAAAQLALARILIAHDDGAAARPILDAMLKAKPADEVTAVHGQLMLKERNPGAAVQDFLSIAANQPANVAVFISLAEAYLQNDQRKEAIAALRRALSLRPSDSGILGRIVEIRSSFGEIPDASRAVDDFLERNPASIDGRAMQIRFAIQSKDWTAAEVALTRFHKIPESERKTVGLDAEIKEARGLYSDAVDLYRQLLTRRENSQFDVLAARAFARVSIAAGQSSQGIDTLARFAANVAPADLASYDLILATLYDSLGQADKTQGLVEAAIQRAPAEPASYLQQAAALARKKEIAKALAFLDRGIAARAPKEPLLLARAGVQSADGQIDNAIATYGELLRINPRSAIGANELANLLADQKQLDKVALREARDLLQKNAVFKNPAILDTLAWSDYRLGDFEKAKELLNLANADQSSIPQMRFHYGAVLIALGEQAKGQKIIRNTLDDTFPGRNEAEKILKD
jgi:tetratricopeptide (TPR) repeat protein